MIFSKQWDFLAMQDAEEKRKPNSLTRYRFSSLTAILILPMLLNRKSNNLSRMEV